ncbi:MAG: hypothetical protein EA403_00035, partial [Spirochaetaceae bacterium]
PTGDRRSDSAFPLVFGNTLTGTAPDFSASTRAFQGIISSVQLSSVVRSPGWIAAKHRGFTGSFVSIGSPEAVQYR